jgi:transcription antitermination factor NusG
MMTPSTVLPQLNWFAIYTTPRHEKHVHEQLKGREIEAFLPLYRSQRLWRNRAHVAVDLPLFPSYLFARITPFRKVAVLSVPGVLSIVGSRRELWPLPDSTIASLRAGMNERNPEPCPYLVVGERARINAGPLMGMEGVLLRRNNGVRMVLSLDHIMRSFSVEVGPGDLEPVTRNWARAS